MKPSIVFVLLAMAGCGLAACDKTGDATSEDNVQRRNPASVFCAEQGGENLLVSGECRLVDGTVVDAWDYYRQHHPDVSEEE